LIPFGDHAGDKFAPIYTPASLRFVPLKMLVGSATAATAVCVSGKYCSKPSVLRLVVSDRARKKLNCVLSYATDLTPGMISATVVVVTGTDVVVVVEASVVVEVLAGASDVAVVTSMAVAEVPGCDWPPPHEVKARTPIAMAIGAAKAANRLFMRKPLQFELVTRVFVWSVNVSCLGGLPEPDTSTHANRSAGLSFGVKRRE
jgi:hypothetical protein